jgi:hypothetical protein
MTKAALLQTLGVQNDLLLYMLLCLEFGRIEPQSAAAAAAAAAGRKKKAAVVTLLRSNLMAVSKAFCSGGRTRQFHSTI